MIQPSKLRPFHLKLDFEQASVVVECGYTLCFFACYLVAFKAVISEIPQLRSLHLLLLVVKRVLHLTTGNVLVLNDLWTSKESYLPMCLAVIGLCVQWIGVGSTLS